MPNASRRRPTALISWSHIDPGWSADQITARQDAVLELTNALRRNGIKADVDVFHLSGSVDWSRWGPRRAGECDFVLVIVSAGWRAAWEGRGDPTKGAGAAAEADVLRSIYAADRDMFMRKVRLIVLPGVTSKNIPDGLHGVPRFQLATVDDAGLSGLLRNLTGQPEFIKGELGELPELPPATVPSQSPRFPVGGVPSAPADAVKEGAEGADLTPGQRNALTKARDYLRFMPFSAGGLVKQLAADGFSAEDAEFAVVDVDASWEEQAARKVDAYLAAMPFSATGLLAQLVSDGFGEADAESAVRRVKVDWDEQAEKKASQCLASMSFSETGLIRQLISDGFTDGQAQAGVARAYR